MLGFANKQIEVKTLLSNANEVSKFSPEGPTNNILRINKNNEIEVSTKEVHNDEMDQLTQQIRKLTFEKDESFANEKMILLWHFSQILPYLSARLAQLRDMPIDTLHQYHDNSMQFQGFYQLCQNMFSQLAHFNELFTRLENPHKQYWSMQFKLLQKYLSDDFEKAINTAQEFVTQIARQRKEKLTVETPDLEVRGHAQGLLLREITRAMPLKYSLGAVKVGEQRHHVKGYFQTMRATWTDPNKFQFTGKLTITVLNGESELHATMSVFPCWDTLPHEEKSKTDLDSPQDTPYDIVNKLHSEHQRGTITFEPATLRAHFSKQCTHVTASEMLPFFVTLVGIAESHHMSEVTVYAPYNQSAIMYALGFYPLPTDKMNPNFEQQKHTVENAYIAGIEVPYLNENLNRRTDTNNPLLRPFCFNTHLLAIRPVYATEARLKTTYAKLLSDSSISRYDHGTEGILSEVLQIPLKFTGALFALRERETTGKLRKPSVSVDVCSVDYQALEKNAELQNYAFSDTAASVQAQYKKMLTHKKK